MEGATNSDGRLPRLALPEEQATGVFRISFATGDWFKARGIAGFYPSVSIVFEITAPSEHYHVPLLLGPYGYSTYRGS
jgi:5-hydroxyisourate hydrolase